MALLPPLHIISVLLALLLSTSATPTPLHPRAKPFYCIPSQRFTLGYQVCTFTSLISSTIFALETAPSKPLIAHLWVFDSLCHILGTSPPITISSLPPAADASSADLDASESHVFNFGSDLHYVAVTDLRDGQSPVVVKYGGKSWGGKASQCWDDDVNGGYVCSFEFNCEAAKKVTSLGLSGVDGTDGDGTGALGALGEEGVVDGEGRGDGEDKTAEMSGDEGLDA